MKESRHQYAVEIKREDGTSFLATGQISGCVALFYRRGEAKKFLADLRDHGFKRLRVVGVNLSFEWPAKKLRK